MGFRMLRTAAALVTVLLLAGCVPREPVITPEPDPASTPVFASDEEALAAATEAYARYLEVSDQIAQDGGEGADRMKGLVSPEQYEKELEGFQMFVDEGIHAVGRSKFDSVSMQSWVESDAGVADVTIYACSDASGVRVFDSKGIDVTPTNRPERSPFELQFISQSGVGGKLILSRSELWSGADFC